MIGKWFYRTARSAALLALCALGCTSERPPINRVQANALDKSFFVGALNDPTDDPVFYWRNFVVDGSESQSLIGVGSWSGVDRVRFEITENTLFARRAYPQNPGADDKGGADDFPSGTVVAAYPIVSHFDIVRDYNPQTGEELNIVEENTTDRVWHQRRYFRVDWSINLVETPLWSDMFAGKVFGNIKVTPLAYYVADPNHDDAPRFEPEEGYFDVTSKFWVEPVSVDVGPDSVPMCILIGLYTGNAVDGCDPQEATVRSSYWRVDQVDPDADFEPFENSRATLDIVGNPGGIGDAYSVGIVTPPRIEWDPQYGYTDSNLRRFMHIHDIWEQSHQTRGSCQNDADCGGGGSRCLPSGTCTVPCRYEARRDQGPNGSNGTDDQCENADTGYAGSEGSQCSIRNRCTIPYRDRVVEPVLYWMNKETPLELTDTVGEDGTVIERGPSEDIIFSWNQLLKQSVAKAREVECRRTGGSRSECHALYFEPDQIEMVSYGGWGIEKVKPMPDVLLACHNPVRAYDHPNCGEVGYSARVGDLRHNFLFYWPYASRVPWGGIANWNADPLTGQIIGASATTMGRSATFSAALTRDIIMVANGELSMTDITGGTPAALYEKQLQGGRKPVALSKEEIAERVASIDAKNVMEQMGPQLLAGSVKQGLQHYFELKKNTVSGIGPASTAQLEYQAYADKLRGSVFEAQLVNSNWLVDSAGLAPNTPLTEEILNLVSPLRGHDHFQDMSSERLMNLRYQARGICFTEPLTSNVGNLDVQGVARYFAQKYSNDALIARFPDEFNAETPRPILSRRRAELIYDELWKETYKGIQLHEVGHSLGLLHQFASSYDSTNYNPQYWQLRSQEGQALASCDGQPRTGNTYSAEQDSCMGPRYLDPETDDELGQAQEPRPGINYFGHTSTMEYQNERFFETVGLGQYDQHSMNVLYGRVLQTFDAESPDGLAREQQLTFSTRNATQLSDDNLVLWNNPELNSEALEGTFVNPMHYTEAARQMKLFDPSRCREATAEERAHAQWRIVHGKVCAPPPKDYATWDDFIDGLPLDVSGNVYGIGWSARKAQVRPGAPGGGNIRWPYRWGVSVNSYPHTNSNDAGADIYEVTIETIRKFEYSYPFNYFRRQRRDWYYPGVPARTAGNFFERLRAYHWSIASSNAYFRTFGEEVFEELAASDNWWRPFIMAETAMFDAIARALVMPQIGSFTMAPNFTPSDSTQLLYDPDGEGTGVARPIAFTLDAATARFIDPSYDGGPAAGGSWDYLNWINWTGFGAEKVDAAKALTDGRGVFFTISRDNYLDGRNLNINFRSDMPKAVDRLLGGLLSRDWETIAPHVNRGEASPDVHLLDLNAETPTRPDDVYLLFPNVSYRQQLGALVWGHIFSRLNTDLTLANKLRIWVDGLVGEIEVPESEQIRFFNPESGFTYIARRYGEDMVDGKIVEAGIASRMLQRANHFLTEAYEVERDADDNPLLDSFGLPTLVRDADGKPIRISDDPTTSQDDAELSINRLRNYVGLLDASVQINNLVGFGPFNGVPTDF